MALIPKDWGIGASAHHDSHGVRTSLADFARDGNDDMTETRAQFNALLAKLDADAGVTDADYVALLTPAAQKNTNSP
jgi:hypothetical protein